MLPLLIYRFPQGKPTASPFVVEVDTSEIQRKIDREEAKGAHHIKKSQSIEQNFKKIQDLETQCKVCAGIDGLSNLLDAFHMQCKCQSLHSCCCIKKIWQLLNKYEGKFVGGLASENKDVENEFFPKRVLGMLKYFCQVCYNAKNASGAFAKIGVTYSKRYDLQAAMKRHLQTKEHETSLKARGHVEKLYDVSSLPTSLLREKCTENSCLAAVLISSHFLPTRFYPELCYFISEILENIAGKPVVNPLGNMSQSHVAISNFYLAVFDSYREMVVANNNEINPLTGQAKRYMVAADKGTAVKDAERQAITETHIGTDGLPVESLVSVACIYDKTALGAAEHLKSHLSEIIDTKNVVVISTDGASVYFGKHRGMLELLRNDESFSRKVIGMPDLCHKSERWIKNTSPLWLHKTLDQSTQVVTVMNRKHIFNALSAFAK